MARASPLLPAPGCASRPHYLLTETQPLAASQGTCTGVCCRLNALLCNLVQMFPSSEVYCSENELQRDCKSLAEKQWS